MTEYAHFDNAVPCGGSGLAVGANGSEVDVFDSGAALTDEYTVTTTATPATGSCGVQFVFKDRAGNALTEPIAGLLYLSEVSTGLTQDLADTSIAVLTNGALTNVGGAGPSLFTTTAAGLLGVTITAAADNYWVVFVLPNGKLLISDVCTVNT